jgi:hypothetical protein
VLGAAAIIDCAMTSPEELAYAEAVRSIEQQSRS